MNRFNHFTTLTLSISIKMGEMVALMLFATSFKLSSLASELLVSISKEYAAFKRKADLKKRSNWCKTKIRQ